MSGNGNKERRAFELMQQLNNQLTYSNKRDGSGRWQHKQAKKTRYGNGNSAVSERRRHEWQAGKFHNIVHRLWYSVTIW